MDIHGDMSTAAGTSTLGAEQPPDHPSPIISSASSPLSSPPCSPPVPGPSADHMRNTPGYLDDELDETSHKRARTAAPEEKIGAKGSTTSTRGYTPAGQGPGEEKPETQVHAPK